MESNCSWLQSAFGFILWCKFVFLRNISDCISSRKKLRDIEALEAKLASGEISAPEPEQLEKVSEIDLHLSKSNLRFFLYSATCRKYFSVRCPGKLMWWRRSQPWRRWWRRSLQLDLEEKTLTHKFISHFSWEHVGLYQWRICQRNPLYTMLGIPHWHSLTVLSGNVFQTRLFVSVVVKVKLSIVK